MKRKFVREKIDASKLQIGQKVKYGLFSNITFEGFDDNGEVILKDKYNNVKKIYRYLFEENAKIVNSQY